MPAQDRARFANLAGVGKKSLASIEALVPDLNFGPDSADFPTPDDLILHMKNTNGVRPHGSVTKAIHRIYAELGYKRIPGPTNSSRTTPDADTTLINPPMGRNPKVGMVAPVVPSGRPIHDPERLITAGRVEFSDGFSGMTVKPSNEPVLPASAQPSSAMAAGMRGDNFLAPNDPARDPSSTGITINSNNTNNAGSGGQSLLRQAAELGAVGVAAYGAQKGYQKAKAMYQSSQAGAANVVEQNAVQAPSELRTAQATEMARIGGSRPVASEVRAMGQSDAELGIARAAENRAAGIAATESEKRLAAMTMNRVEKATGGRLAGWLESSAVKFLARTAELGVGVATVFQPELALADEGIVASIEAAIEGGDMVAAEGILSKAAVEQAEKVAATQVAERGAARGAMERATDAASFAPTGQNPTITNIAEYGDGQAYAQNANGMPRQAAQGTERNMTRGLNKQGRDYLKANRTEVQPLLNGDHTIDIEEGSYVDDDWKEDVRGGSNWQRGIYDKAWQTGIRNRKKVGFFTGLLGLGTAVTVAGSELPSSTQSKTNSYVTGTHGITPNMSNANAIGRNTAMLQDTSSKHIERSRIQSMNNRIMSSDMGGDMYPHSAQSSGSTHPNPMTNGMSVQDSMQMRTLAAKNRTGRNGTMSNYDQSIMRELQTRASQSAGSSRQKLGVEQQSNIPGVLRSNATSDINPMEQQQPQQGSAPTATSQFGNTQDSNSGSGGGGGGGGSDIPGGQTGSGNHTYAPGSIPGKMPENAPAWAKDKNTLENNKIAVDALPEKYKQAIASYPSLSGQAKDDMDKLLMYAKMYLVGETKFPGSKIDVEAEFLKAFGPVGEITEQTADGIISRPFDPTKDGEIYDKYYGSIHSESGADDTLLEGDTITWTDKVNKAAYNTAGKSYADASGRFSSAEDAYKSINDSERTFWMNMKKEATAKGIDTTTEEWKYPWNNKDWVDMYIQNNPEFKNHEDQLPWNKSPDKMKNAWMQDPSAEGPGKVVRTSVTMPADQINTQSALDQGRAGSAINDDGMLRPYLPVAIGWEVLPPQGDAYAKGKEAALHDARMGTPYENGSVQDNLWLAQHAYSQHRALESGFFLPHEIGPSNERNAMFNNPVGVRPSRQQILNAMSRKRKREDPEIPHLDPDLMQAEYLGWNEYAQATNHPLDGDVLSNPLYTYRQNDMPAAQPGARVPELAYRNPTGRDRYDSWSGRPRSGIKRGLTLRGIFS